MQCYLKAARQAHQDPMPVEKISQLYVRLGNIERASQAACFAAELYPKNFELKKAHQLWERTIQLQPGDQLAYGRLAALNERLEEKDHAVQEYLALASLL